MKVASELISHNQNRVGKNLETTKDAGDLVKLNCFKNAKNEAVGVSDEIEKKFNVEKELLTQYHTLGLYFTVMSEDFTRWLSPL